MAKGEEKARRMTLRRKNGTRETPEYPKRKERGPEYLVAHACFACRKSWKMPPEKDVPVCPECGGKVAEMGRSFKAPKKADHEQWSKVEKLWFAGFRFFSFRSYPDAEPFPKQLRDVDDFIERNPGHPFRVVK